MKILAVKQCSKCKRILAVTEFYKDNARPSGLRCQCKQCVKSAQYSNCTICRNRKQIHFKGMCDSCHTKWLKLNDPDKYTSRLKHQIEMRRKRLGDTDYRLNKSCASYLGVHIAERILSKVFNDVKMMPMHNPGYDFVCKHGKKIDVKSSCIRNRKNRSSQWAFNICKNQSPDYFLCIAFDNREYLNPLHLWLIDGNEINSCESIAISKTTIDKWDKFKLPLDSVISCCDSLKQKGVNNEK